MALVGTSRSSRALSAVFVSGTRCVVSAQRESGERQSEGHALAQTDQRSISKRPHSREQGIAASGLACRQDARDAIPQRAGTAKHDADVEFSFVRRLPDVEDRREHAEAHDGLGIRPQDDLGTSAWTASRRARGAALVERRRSRKLFARKSRTRERGGTHAADDGAQPAEASGRSYPASGRA